VSDIIGGIFVALTMGSVIYLIVAEAIRDVRRRTGLIWQDGRWREVVEVDRLDDLSCVELVCREVGVYPIPTWIESDRVKWRLSGRES
jgi:hypothetical protein